MIKDHLGQEFKSISEMAEHWGKSYSVVYSRLNAGWDIKRVLEEPPALRNTDFSVYGEIKKDGLTFKSLGEACRHYGLSISTVSRRISRGNLTPEEALYPLKTTAREVTYKVGKYYEDYDHVLYDSLSDMCKAHGVLVRDFKQSWKEGQPLEECLNPKFGSTKISTITDHLGNEYSSEHAMAEAWGVKYCTYRQRKREGKSLKACLAPIILPVDRPSLRKTPCEDHLGNKFESLQAMFNYWGVTRSLYFYRKNVGYPMEVCLNPERLDREADYYIKLHRQEAECKDHLGNTFASEYEMCAEWGQSFCNYRRLLKEGVPLKDILEGMVEDHLGNKFHSEKEMCDFHKTPKTTYLYRKSKGLPLEVCLNPNHLRCPNKNHSNPCEDYLGNKYDTYTEMCKAHGITLQTYRSRIKRGMSNEESLTKDSKYDHHASHGRDIPCEDHLGNKFPNKKAMCSYWGITWYLFRDRVNSGWTWEEALTLPKGVRIKDVRSRRQGG